MDGRVHSANWCICRVQQLAMCSLMGNLMEQVQQLSVARQRAMRTTDQAAEQLARRVCTISLNFVTT